FRDSLMHPYMRLYFQVDPNSIHYKKTEAGVLVSKLRTEIRVHSDTGIIFRETYYLQTKPFPPGEPPSAILEQQRLSLPRTGRYKVELRLSEDAFPQAMYYTDSGYTTPPPAPFYSGIQLVDTFVGASELTQIPKPFLHGRFVNVPKPLAF